ncbi:MAG: hypothetical protein RLZZ265_874 [Verrucomicrobiota bacterium]|jgi:hypothetical protein
MTTLRKIDKRLEQYKGLWVVEWNEDQKAFHYERAYSRLRDSVRGYLSKKGRGSWVTLGVFNTSKECCEYIEELTSARPED